jgi:pimeloyl-ACP methyl ester carboxylesterase
MFHGLAAELELDFYLVALEYPGSGWSDAMPDGAGLGEIGSAFLDAIDQLNLENFSVYGHHTGNKVAAAMAAAHPDRISKLIFVGQSHSIVASNKQRSGTVGIHRRKLFNATDEREAALVQWADLFSRISSKFWDEKLVRHLPDTGRRGFVARKLADEILSAMSMPSLYNANFAYDLEHDLRNLTSPTLIVEIASPSEDAAIGRQGAHLKKIMKSATVVVLEEPDWRGNTMEHRAADLASLVRSFLLDNPPSPQTARA